jgi:hypothetical protein
MKQVIIGFCVLFIHLRSSLHPWLLPREAPARSHQAPVLCPPGVYLIESLDCQPLGPSAYLTRLAEFGLTFPLKPLAAQKRDPQLGYVPYQYAIMKEKSAKIYTSLEDAIAKSPPAAIIGQGELKYVSYLETVDSHGELFFHLRSGGWIAASDGIASRVSTPGSFPGALVFQATPPRSFGWILPLAAYVETKRTPGYTPEDYTGNQIPQYGLVQVYATKRVGEMDWYMIGPDEWIEQRMIGRVVSNPLTP